MFLGLHTGYVSEFIRVHPPLDPNSVFQPRLNRSRGWRFRTGKFPPHLLKPSRTWLPGAEAGVGGRRFGSPEDSFRFIGTIRSNRLGNGLPIPRGTDPNGRPRRSIRRTD